jgi:2C-methyl-D-erythritol 2,4-cyclodiphosphate synthase
VVDDSNQQIEYIDCSLIHNKPRIIKKNQTYSAQLAYSIHKNTKELFLKFHTQYTNDTALFQLPVYR